MVGQFLSLGLVAEQESDRCKETRIPVSDKLPCSTNSNEERCHEHVSNRGEGPTAQWMNDEYHSEPNLKAKNEEQRKNQDRLWATMP